jgi:flagellar biosynthesis component FlhA
MSTTTYTLRCFVEGDNTAFDVIASSTVFIAELKEMIKEEKSDLLQRVDASSLILWKVCIRISSDSF